MLRKPKTPHEKKATDYMSLMNIEAKILNKTLVNLAKACGGCLCNMISAQCSKCQSEEIQ